MKVTVAMVSYRRAWALPHSLSSLARQTKRPDEVVIVLKPSSDGSEEVISKFAHQLPIKLVVQRQGNSTDAYQMAIDNANGDIIAFLDDDAIAEEKWVQKFVLLFESLPRAGGIGGIIHKVYIKGNYSKMASESLVHRGPPKVAFYKRPLPEYSGYVSWVSRSGFTSAREAPKAEVFKSLTLTGANMAFKRELLVGIPLARLYRRSRKGFFFETLLGHYVRKRGYDIYEVRGPQAPVVWHIMHDQSLTRGKGFWHEFWFHYDRVANYWRLKELGTEVSFPLYVVACIAALRIKTLPRLLATVYAWVVRV